MENVKTWTYGNSLNPNIFFSTY